jgi:hypothetical protein
MTCPPFLFREVSIAAGRDAYLAALRRCPQTALRLFGGALSMISAHRFAFGALVSLTAKIEAPLREPPTSNQSASLPPISSVAMSPACRANGSKNRPKWGAANAPSSLRYGDNFKPLTRCCTMAGAVCGGHVPRSARPATKLPYAELTARNESSLEQNSLQNSPHVSEHRDANHQPRSNTRE